jgi:hypothetical protein
LLSKFHSRHFAPIVSCDSSAASVASCLASPTPRVAFCAPFLSLPRLVSYRPAVGQSSLHSRPRFAYSPFSPLLPRRLSFVRHAVGQVSFVLVRRIHPFRPRVLHSSFLPFSIPLLQSPFIPVLSSPGGHLGYAAIIHQSRTFQV